MVSDRLNAHPHHLDLATSVAGDVRRHLDRLGRMRALAVVRVGVSGAYSIGVVDAETVRPSVLSGLGLSLSESLDLIDGVLAYNPDREAAVLVVESNPVDGQLFSFLTLEWGRPLEMV